MKRDNRVYLEDILESIALIKKYTAGISEKEFESDVKLQDAVTRRLEIIGEATKHISKKFRDTHSEIPWKKMTGLRDILVHEYFGIEMKRINKVIKEELRGLELKLQALLFDIKSL